MADFDIAHHELMKTQGIYPFFDSQHREKGDVVVCSECFSDEGLRLDAANLGIKQKAACPRCGNGNGAKLTQQIARELAYRFFVRGSVEQFEYGGCPLIQMNEARFGSSDIDIAPWLKDDFALLEKATGLGFFYYQPRLCALGEVEPLKALQNPGGADAVVEQILQFYPKHILNGAHPMYRVRVNPDKPGDFREYDSAPREKSGHNRFDENGEAVLYASPDLELCIQECRTSVPDELYVAKLVPKQPLLFLNLAALVEQDVSEFESLDICMHYLFLASRHAYPICSKIARRVREAGFDGIIYPSYFSNLRTGHTPFETIHGLSIRVMKDLHPYAQSQTVPNVAIFGHPVADGRLAVQSINRVVINSMRYDLSFGPVSADVLIDKKDKQQFVQQRMQQLQDKMEKMMKEIQEEKTGS